MRRSAEKAGLPNWGRRRIHAPETRRRAGKTGAQRPKGGGEVSPPMSLPVRASWARATTRGGVESRAQLSLFPRLREAVNLDTSYRVRGIAFFSLDTALVGGWGGFILRCLYASSPDLGYR